MLGGSRNLKRRGLQFDSRPPREPARFLGRPHARNQNAMCLAVGQAARQDLMRRQGSNRRFCLVPKGHVYTHTYMHASIHAYLHAGICMYIYMHRYIYMTMRTPMYTCMYMHIYIYRYISIYTYIQTSLQGYTRTYTCVCEA